MKSLFSIDGPLTSVFRYIGEQGFFSSYAGFLPVLSYAILWRETGPFALIIYLGIQAIDRSFVEMTEIDGASPIRRFVHLTLPFTRSQRYLLFVLLSLSFIGGLFDPIYPSIESRALRAYRHPRYLSLPGRDHERRFPGGHGARAG